MTVEANEPAGAVTRLLRSVLPFVLLAASAAGALASSPHEPQQIATILAPAAGAAVWLWLAFPGPVSWSERRTGILVYFAGLLLFTVGLVALNPWFMIFSAIGYAHAFVLLPPKWLVIGAAATAMLTAVAQDGLRVSDTLVPPLVFSIALPLLFVSWFVGRQSERRHAMITQLADANAKLEAALRENTGLHAQLLAQAREAGVLDERQRLAREIHDTLAQGLIGIITQLQASERSKARPEVRQQHLDNAIQLAQESLAEARRSVRAVRPELLESARLAEALGEVVGRWNAMQATVEPAGLGGPPAAEARFTSSGPARRLHLDVEVALLRGLQESLANAAKHAHPGAVEVRLDYGADAVVLDVHDDGAGFDPDAAAAPDAPGGFGLAAMRQRAAQLGGSLAVTSAPGAGTTVLLRIPAWPPAGASTEATDA
jgi:signal transduction histidine kinase